MNQELLRKLKLEAGGSFFEHVNSDIQEKFAELIVNECLTICENFGDKGMDGHYCADEIKKHFGVK